MDHIHYVRQICGILGNKSLVLSHNDLLKGNILFRAKDKKIFFIDFDFICYNYSSFDIASFFHELQFDYDVKEPPYFSWRKGTREIEEAFEKFLREFVVFQAHDLKNVETLD